MEPVQLILERAAILLGSDTATFFNGDGLEIHLAQNLFAPGPGLVIGDLVQADFDGYNPAVRASAALPESLDPINGDIVLSINSLTGLPYETTGTTNLPQTIYGFYLTDQDETVVWAAELFDAPITLTGINQSIQLPVTTMRMQPGFIQ